MQLLEDGNFFNSFNQAPTTISSNTVNSTGDAIHVAVVDEDGGITGTSVL